MFISEYILTIQWTVRSLYKHLIACLQLKVIFLNIDTPVLGTIFIPILRPWTIFFYVLHGTTIAPAFVCEINSKATAITTGSAGRIWSQQPLFQSTLEIFFLDLFIRKTLIYLACQCSLYYQ